VVFASTMEAASTRRYIVFDVRGGGYRCPVGHAHCVVLPRQRPFAGRRLTRSARNANPVSPNLYSLGGGPTLDLPLIRSAISPVAADRASVMRCRRPLPVAGARWCCCHRCCQLSPSRPVASRPGPQTVPAARTRSSAAAGARALKPSSHYFLALQRPGPGDRSAAVPPCLRE
jgi:hypothetical protein